MNGALGTGNLAGPLTFFSGFGVVFDDVARDPGHSVDLMETSIHSSIPYSHH